MTNAVTSVYILKFFLPPGGVAEAVKTIRRPVIIEANVAASTPSTPSAASRQAAAAGDEASRVRTVPSCLRHPFREHPIILYPESFQEK